MKDKSNDTIQNPLLKKSRSNRFIWHRFSRSRECSDRRRGPHRRKPSVIQSGDISSAPDVQDTPAQSSDSWDMGSATTLCCEDAGQEQEVPSLLSQSYTTVYSEDTGQEEELYSLVWQSQIAEIELEEGLDII